MLHQYLLGGEFKVTCKTSRFMVTTTMSLQVKEHYKPSRTVVAKVSSGMHLGDMCSEFRLDVEGGFTPLRCMWTHKLGGMSMIFRYMLAEKIFFTERCSARGKVGTLG
jgi:hypothetical protein